MTIDMNRINPSKLQLSKWTAVFPVSREKHFLVSKIEFDEEGVVILCQIEAVISKKSYDIDWVELQKTEKWQQGWK